MARVVAFLALLAMPALVSSFTSVFSSDCSITYFDNVFCPKATMLTYNGFTVATAPTVITSPTSFPDSITSANQPPNGLILNDRERPPPTWSELSRACSYCCSAFSGVVSGSISTPYYYSISGLTEQTTLENGVTDTWATAECRCAPPPGSAHCIAWGLGRTPPSGQPRLPPPHPFMLPSPHSPHFTNLTILFRDDALELQVLR